MRILHVCQDAGVPVFGRKGGSTHIRELCRAWIAGGHDVRLVAASAGEDDGGPLRDRVTVVRPSTSRLLGGDLRRVLTNRRFRRALPRLVRDLRPELVYERHSLYTGAARRLARELGVPHLLEVNAILSDELRARLHHPRWAERIERGALLGADHLIVVSEALRRRAAEWGVPESRVTLQPISVDAEHFAPRPRDPARRAAWGWQTGDVVIGYLGALTKWHQPALLVSAFARLTREQPGVRLLFLGGDEGHIVSLREGRLVPEPASGSMRFAGSVPYAQVPGLLAEFDIGVLPGLHAWATPTKLFEYAAMGLAIVAPRTPSVEAVIEDGVTGLLFVPGDADALADALARLVADPARRHSLGEAARRDVLAKHTWAAHAARLMAIGQDLAAASRQSS